MTREILNQQEFEKKIGEDYPELFNEEQKATYKEQLEKKYGKNEVDKMEKAAGIINTAMNDFLINLLA